MKRIIISLVLLLLLFPVGCAVPPQVTGTFIEGTSGGDAGLSGLELGSQCRAEVGQDPVQMHRPVGEDRIAESKAEMVEAGDRLAARTDHR